MHSNSALKNGICNKQELDDVKNGVIFSHSTLIYKNTFPNIKLFLILVIAVDWSHINIKGCQFLKNNRAAVVLLKKFKKMPKCPPPLQCPSYMASCPTRTYSRLYKYAIVSSFALLVLLNIRLQNRGLA